LSRLDEAACVDNKDFGVISARRQFVALARENAECPS